VENSNIELSIASAPLYINNNIDDNVIASNKLWSSAKTNQKITDEAQARQNADTNLQGQVDSLNAIAHTHSNKNLLDTYNQTNADITDAINKKHEHANKTILDNITESFTTSLKTNYDNHLADTNNPHAVTKAQIGLGNVPNLDTTYAVTNAHTHPNKALLDTYTQTEANLADAVAKKHSHSNLTNNKIPVANNGNLIDSTLTQNSIGGLEIIPTANSGTVFSTTSLQSTAPLGNELVGNGNFSIIPDTNWTWGTGWTHDTTNLRANHTTGNTAALTQNINVISGQTYQVEITITNTTAGFVTLDINGVYIYNYGSEINFTSNITYKRTVVANITGSAILRITPTSDFDGSVDNITVKQITGIIQPNIVLKDNTNNTYVEVRGNNSLNNLSIGLNSGHLITTGNSNSNFGFNAGYSITTGNHNSNFGSYAGRSITTGNGNSNFGFNAGYSITTGSSNSNFGNSAGYSITTGNHNSNFGSYAGHSITTGYNNSNFGYYAGYSITTGSSNSNFGFNAGYSITTGSSNSNFGNSAGYSITTGYNNSNFGYYAGYNASQKVDAVNSIAIGANTYTIVHNQVVIGMSTTTHGLGVIPTLTANGLDINGSTIRLRSLRTITSSSATGNQGEMCYDANYLYICVATNTWKRVSLTTW